MPPRVGPCCRPGCVLVARWDGPGWTPLGACSASGNRTRRCLALPAVSRPCGLLSSTSEITEYVDIACAQATSSHHHDEPSFPWTLLLYFRGSLSRPFAWNTVPRDDPAPREIYHIPRPVRRGATRTFPTLTHPVEAFIGRRVAHLAHPISDRPVLSGGSVSHPAGEKEDIRRPAHEVPVTDFAIAYLVEKGGWMVREEGKGRSPAAGIRDRSAGTGGTSPDREALPSRAKPSHSRPRSVAVGQGPTRRRALSHPPCRAGGIKANLHCQLPGAPGGGDVHL